MKDEQLDKLLGIVDRAVKLLEDWRDHRKTLAAPMAPQPPGQAGTFDGPHPTWTTNVGRPTVRIFEES